MHTDLIWPNRPFYGLGYYRKYLYTSNQSRRSTLMKKSLKKDMMPKMPNVALRKDMMAQMMSSSELMMD
jgi:hypothetical protein